MKAITFILLMTLITSCASQKPRFIKENVCSNQSLKYLKNPRNKYKRAMENPELIQHMANTTRSMQLCYDEFTNRTGVEEFNTCLVVGVDPMGQVDFYNFSSTEIQMDEKFINCAHAVTKTIPFSNYGKNYILIQAYQFYVGEL